MESTQENRLEYYQKSIKSCSKRAIPFSLPTGHKRQPGQWLALHSSDRIVLAALQCMKSKSPKCKVQDADLVYS